MIKSLMDKLDILEKQIIALVKQNIELKNRVSELEALCSTSNKSIQKIKNERNAGRKKRFTPEQEHSIKMMKLNGKSYRAIAKEMNCSVGLVHKIFNEPINI